MVDYTTEEEEGEPNDETAAAAAGLSTNSSILGPELSSSSAVWLSILECIPWYYQEIRYHVSHPNRHTVSTRIRFLLRILYGVEPFLDLIVLWLQQAPRRKQPRYYYDDGYYFKIKYYKECIQCILQTTLLSHQVYAWRQNKRFFLPLLPHHHNYCHDDDDTNDRLQNSASEEMSLVSTKNYRHERRRQNWNCHPRDEEQHYSYIGPRTGRHIGGAFRIMHPRSVVGKGIAYVYLSELLHFLRFPLWTYCNYLGENTKKTKKKSKIYIWLFTLFMDMASVQLLRQGLKLQLLADSGSIRIPTSTTRHHHHHQQQQLFYAFQLLTRRKSLLWLYAIKSPLWESITKPLVVQRVCHLVCKLLPFIGSWVEKHLLSWIDYYQTHHSYILEQEYY
jgi:hypothetical protein